MRKVFQKTIVIVTTAYLALNMISVIASPEELTIRVAILDQLMSQNLSSITYQNDYLNGIKLAAYEAKKKGIQIDYKYFSYDKSPLGIFAVIPEVKQWHPDFIIGPRSSNSMLLLKGKFNNILVASPIATSIQLKILPNNFYSFSLSDQYISKALSIFTLYYFKSISGVLSIPAEDCISCKDVSNLYINNLKKLRPKIDTSQHYFIANNIEQIDMSNILATYRKDDILFTPNLSYVSAVLISKTVNYLNKPNLIFIGGDEWGSHDIAYIGKIPTKHPFYAYHLQDWSMDIKSNETTNFNKEFKYLFKTTTNDNIAYASYHALSSIISIINKKLYLSANSKKEYILKTFLASLHAKSNQFTQPYYVIYQYDENEDKPIALINTTTWKIKDI